MAGMSQEVGEEFLGATKRSSFLDGALAVSLFSGLLLSCSDLRPALVLNGGVTSGRNIQVSGRISF